MRNLLLILMLLAFGVAGIGCYGTGECPGGVCTEEHSKKSAGQEMEEEKSDGKEVEEEKSAGQEMEEEKSDGKEVEEEKSGE